jgi:ligand-binding sensor protein
MELTDIQPLEKWTELVAQIESQSALRVSVYDTRGIRIADGQGAANRLCPEIKATDKGQAFICAVAHMNLARMAKNQRQAVIEECDAGMLKIVVPVFVEDEFIGAVGACGLLAADGEIDAFMISKTTQIDEDRIEALAQGIGSLTGDETAALAALIETRIADLVSAWQKDSP